MLGIAPSVRAEPLPLPLTDQCGPASVLFKGKPAPCSGVLVNPWEAVQAVACVGLDLPEALAERDSTKKFYEGELARAHEQTDAAIEAVNGLQNVISKSTTVPAPSSVLTSPWFWGTTMFLVGVIGGGVVVWALEK
jgi:hypothetical protein